MYYSFDIAYPKSRKGMLQFLQREIIGLKDQQTVPQTLKNWSPIFKRLLDIFVVSMDTALDMTENHY